MKYNKYNLPAYIHYNKNQASFTIKRKGIYYNSFKSLKEAIQHKLWLENHNWSKKEYEKYKNQGRKYYYFHNSFYEVVKNVDNERIYYDHFKTELEAKKCVALLKRLNWDKEAYRRIRNKV